MTNDLRIADAPLLVDVSGEEKLPTGGYGNYSTTINQIADFTQLKWKLATEGYVNNEISVVTNKLNNHTQDKTNPHGVTKEQVGLGEVDNTADLDKPVSAYQQSAIDEKIAKTSIVDNLTTNEATKVLSAKQGKTLQDTKANKADVYTKDETLTLEREDRYVITESGRTQREKNKETVSPEDKGAKGDNTSDDSTALTNVKALGQYQHIDVIKRYKIDTPVNFTFQTLVGRNSRNSGFTGKITASTRAHFEKLRLRSAEGSEDYALEILAGTNGVDNFYNRINNNFFYGHSGIQINGGVETLIDGNRFFGQQSSMSGEKVGTAIDNRNIDNTICNTYIERLKYGVNTGNSMESTNLHIVVADTALTVRGASRSGYSQFVNNYIDSPKDFGILLEDTDNVNFMNTRMYKVNRYNQDGALGIGVRLGGQSSYNRFVNMCFQNLEGNCKQSIDFNGTKHVGNLFVGLSGDHVMSATNQNIMRKQISMGNTKDWSKYNQSNKYRHYFDYVDKDESSNITYKVQIPKGMTITSSQRGSNIIEYNGKIVVRGYGGAGGFFEFKLLSCRDILGIDDNFVKITKIAGVEAMQLSSVTVDHISDTSEFIEVTCVVSHVSTNSTRYQATLEIERGIDSKGSLC